MSNVSTVRLAGSWPLLQVHDMPRAWAFYRDGLGFSVVEASPEVESAEGRFSHWMWLRRDGIDLMLNTAFDSSERPPTEDTARRAGHGDVCLYLGCTSPADVDALHAELAARGFDAAPPSDSAHGLRSFSMSDPDGYTLCIQARL